jgi:arylformamidase
MKEVFKMVRNIGSNSRQVKANKSQWIDISIPLRNAMVHWPTDGPTLIRRILDVDKGDKVTMSEMTLISHTGTHMDAPLHFIYRGKTIDEMPLDTAIGLARVIEIKDTESVKTEELASFNIQRGERILLKTLNSERVYRTDEFVDDYVYISTEAARFLAEKDIRVIGLDYISIGSYKLESNVKETHEAFLSRGIWIIEGLNLSGVKAGNYELICLPIKLEKGDAGLARAILRPV